jgi:HAD superfamily, subfamily IIIB (Acid phosphatase)
VARALAAPRPRQARSHRQAPRPQARDRPRHRRDLAVQLLRDQRRQLHLRKPDASTQTTVAYKSGARTTIEQQGYRIIANVGDQYSDLAGGHEDKAFKLPNPFYFLP